VSMVKVRPIKTEADYDAALARADRLMDAEEGTPEADELDVLVERPLFSPTRRPAESEPTPGAEPLPVEPVAPPSPIDFELIGIVIAGADRTVLIKSGNGSTIEVRESEAYDGWTVVLIEAERVVFRRDLEEVELILNYAGSASPGGLIRQQPNGGAIEDPAELVPPPTLVPNQ